jgi:hypothetical protein
MPVNIDPEIRRQILEEELAAGRILMAEGQYKIKAGALVGRGCMLIQDVDSGKAPLAQLGVGMEYILQGVEQIMAVTGFEQPPSGDGFFPQREGMVPAIRALLQGKQVAAGQLFNVKIEPRETLSEVDQVDVIQGVVSQLQGSLERMNNRLYPMEGSVYKKLKAGWEILGPVFTQEGRVPRWAEPLSAYMTGRYKKAAATRQSNQELKASWSEKNAEEVRKAEEEKIRARTMEEWTNNFVRRLEMERRGSSRDEE